jgi:hypothetical protein
MRKKGSLSRLERGLAIALAAIWLVGGACGIYLALARGRWGLSFVALAAVIYGAAWLRVAARARLLTWNELVAPWRRV